MKTWVSILIWNVYHFYTSNNMKEKRFNILDWNENLITGNLNEEQIQLFLDTYTKEGYHFLIEEIHNEEETK